MTEEDRRRILDEEHLRLLSLFYYISAGITALFSCIPVLYLPMGFMFIFGGEGLNSSSGEPPPAFVGWFLIAFIGIFMLFGWGIAILKFLVGKYISERRHPVLCLVVAGFYCLSMPYGTILGIMTFLVLLRKSVKPLFWPNQALIS